MKEKFDLHVHTNASDGSLSPRDLISKARDEGLEVIAITDHDTTAGVAEAVEAGEESGVKVIPGVEISVDWHSGTNHICGFFLDVENKELKAALKFVQEARAKRNPMMVRKLNDLGIDVTMAEIAVKAGGGQIGRPHFAQVLVEKGYVKDFDEAFEKYLANGAPGYVNKQRLSLKRAVEVIRGAGGVCVLAHPGLLGLAAEQEYRDYFRYARDMGVAGIESYSSAHREEENAMFERLADELQMFSTGGSDFHGESKPQVHLGVFADNCGIEIDKLLETMKALAAE